MFRAAKFTREVFLLIDSSDVLKRYKKGGMSRVSRTALDQFSCSRKTVTDDWGPRYLLENFKNKLPYSHIQVALQLPGFFVPLRESANRDSTCFACEPLVKQMVVIPPTIDSFVCPFISSIKSMSASISQIIRDC